MPSDAHQLEPRIFQNFTLQRGGDWTCLILALTRPKAPRVLRESSCRWSLCSLASSDLPGCAHSLNAPKDLMRLQARVSPRLLNQ